MKEPHFEYGPVARGIYTALLGVTFIIAWHFSHYLNYYTMFLLFLGLGLKPLIIKTGLYRFTQYLLGERQEKADKEYAIKRQREIDRQRRNI